MVNRRLVLLFTIVFVSLFIVSLGCVGNVGNNTSEESPSSTPSDDNDTSNASLASSNSVNEVDSINTSVTVIKDNNASGSSSIATVSISSPISGDTVKYTELVSGTTTGVYGSGLHLYVLVNPIETGEEWWIQPESTVSSDGSWQTLVYFGEKTGDFIGKEFRVSAIVTSEKLSSGKLNNSVAAECRVDKDILVTRG